MFALKEQSPSPVQTCAAVEAPRKSRLLDFDAAIFDMDGVITTTAGAHSHAWKRMFDGFLQAYARRTGQPFREFTHARDYLSFVDGRPRYLGVAAFLKSRGIELPFGNPTDAPTTETVCGLGNRKNEVFNQVLDRKGVGLYDSTLTLIRELIACGVKVGVATSSKNCVRILTKAGILNLFAARVDGVVSAELGLKGKPEPDIFTTACDRLDAPYSRSIVIEDAVSGVEAGAKGGFALVIGVARENNAAELKAHGADVVVNDLAELDVEKINQLVLAIAATRKRITNPE
jgi:HAD superfamily hydrolase (TIGR01509 family)